MRKQLLSFGLGLAVMAGLGYTSKPTGQQPVDRGLARVEKPSGKYMFLQCEPLAEYDVVFDVKIGLIWSDEQRNSLVKIGSLVMNKAVKIAEKEKKEFDAIIVKDGQKADLAIKFK